MSDEDEPRLLAVTGVGGFIGMRLAERAARDGWRVRGLDVSASALAQAEARVPGLEPIVGDILRPGDCDALARGADALVHTAAVVREDGPRALFERINVGGTHEVASAATRAGVGHLVHLSSVMVYGFDFPDGVEEEGPFPTHEKNPYVTTKRAGEGAAMAAGPPGGVTLLRPGDVYGPGSVPWVERPVALMRAGLFVLPSGDGRINHVHVDNLVDALLLVLERGPQNQPFNITDGVGTSCREYFTRLFAQAGLPPPRTAPASVLRAAFTALSAGAALVRREPPARPAALDYLLRSGTYSIARARRVLGYRPRKDLTQGLLELAPSLLAR
jgi:nucleoside-diphosphate-sugar epimerase